MNARRTASQDPWGHDTLCSSPDCPCWREGRRGGDEEVERLRAELRQVKTLLRRVSAAAYVLASGGERTT